MRQWELLHRRRIESWRVKTAADAVVTAKAFRSGKLKSALADQVITYPRTAKRAVAT